MGMKNIMFLIISMCLITNTIALNTSIMFRNGVDIDRLLNITYSIDESLFDGLDRLEFRTDSYNNYLGYYNYKYYERNEHKKYKQGSGKIKTFNTNEQTNFQLTCIIYHELGHHHHIGKLGKLNMTHEESERVANIFMKEKYSEECSA